MKTVNTSVAALVAKLQEGRDHNWQYLEVKQMAEILSRHRDKTRQHLRDYRALKKALLAETDAIEKLYLGYEGMFMRDHLRDALRLYVMVNRDYHEAHAAYMNEVTHPSEITIPFATLLPSANLNAAPKAQRKPRRDAA